MLVAYILLGLAILSVWAPQISVAERRLPVWTLLLAASVVAASISHLAAPSGVIVIVILAALTWGANISTGVLRRVLTVLAALCALALSLHIKGIVFNNIALFDNVKLTPDAAPFTQYASFNKGVAGLLMLALCVPGARLKGWTSAARLAPIATLVTAAITLGAAVAAGVTRFEPKVPEGAVLFLIVNLLFTVVAEEAFFRGLIQGSLLNAADARARAWLRPTALAVSALTFGLAHAAGGAFYVVFATLAGLGYAWVFQRTRAIEASIATHLGFNALHFFLFAYPTLAR